MNRLETWTIVGLLGAALSAYDLVTDWTAPGGALALVVVFGLFGGSIAVFVGELVAGIHDRKRIGSTQPASQALLARAARGVRWSSVLAIALGVLLFANCSGGVISGNSLSTGGPLGDPRFWPMAAALMLPLLLGLAAPAALATSAQFLGARRPESAFLVAQVALWSLVFLAAAAVLTVAAGFFLGVSQCFGNSPGPCAAGVGSMTNILSLGSLALFLPYLLMMTAALRRELAARRQGETPGQMSAT